MSQHQHYEIIQRLSAALKHTLTGGKVLKAYTLSKTEIVICFETQLGEPFVFRQTIQFGNCFNFFDTNIPPTTSNAQPIFQQIYELPIIQIKQHAHNRSFEIDFGSDQLLIFKCYNALSNILLMHAGKVSELFRDSIQNDHKLAYSDFLNSDVQQLHSISHSDNLYVVSHHTDDKLPYHLTLVSNHHLHFSTTDIYEAYNYFSRNNLRELSLTDTRRTLTSRFTHEIQSTQKKLNALKQDLEKLNHERSPEEIGHIIMANLHAIPDQTGLIQLFDFYNNQNLQIKLNSELTPLQNAEHYYRKAKSRPEQVQQLEHKIEQLTAQLLRLEDIMQQVQQAKDIKQLQQFEKSSAKHKAPFPFRKFVVHGFEIWVGKSAENNDVLTLRYAHKNDMWLHAKDVSGSHVVIKHKSGQAFPNAVIEQAAAIAAYYSKLKGSGLVPVIYTPRKFVRKSKHLHPGQVMVDREEVLMIEPGLPV